MPGQNSNSKRDDAEEESNNISNNNINNISNNIDNIKSSRNKLINESNEPMKFKDKKGFPLNSETENLNEPLKTIESARKGMIEAPKNNHIQERLKDSTNKTQNNLINLSFKSGDWDVRNENSINPIEIKSSSSKKNQLVQENKNYSMSDFEESFREENVPKKI